MKHLCSKITCITVAVLAAVFVQAQTGTITSLSAKTDNSKEGKSVNSSDKCVNATMTENVSVTTLRKVAVGGSAEAQFELGKCYANGEGPQTQWHPDRLKVYGANNVTNSREGGERHINFGNMKLKNDVLGRIRPVSKERDSKSSWKWITGYAVLIAILLARIFNLNLSFGNIADQSVTSKEGCCAIAAIIISFFVFSYCTAGDGHLNWGIVFGIPVCLLSIVIIRWQLFVKLRQKAIAGDTGAILEVARRYAKGNGVKRNEVEAMMWYGKVARQGNPEAANWFRNLAERGSAQAQYNLGVCYENGEGVEKDTSEAMKWYRIASEQGHKEAGTALQKLKDSHHEK